MKKVKKGHLRGAKLERVRTEREAMTAAASSWIIALHASFQDDDCVYLVLEFAPGGDFMGLLMREDVLDEDRTRAVAAEMVMAIDAVHSCGWIHRDIKPDNMLIDGFGHVRLADFGLSTVFGEREESSTSSALSDEPSAGGRRALAKSRVGTPNYLAPEALLNMEYGEGVDWWSLGAVLYETLFGYAPFHGRTGKETCKRVVDWRRTLQFPPRARSLSPECLSFIKGLLTDAATRLSIDQIKAHPWFAGLSWDDVHPSTRDGPLPLYPDILHAAQKLSTLPSGHPEIADLLPTVVAYFGDCVSEVAPPPPVDSESKISTVNPHVCGFTFVRTLRHPFALEPRSSITAAISDELPQEEAEENPRKMDLD